MIGLLASAAKVEPVWVGLTGPDVLALLLCIPLAIYAAAVLINALSR